MNMNMKIRLAGVVVLIIGFTLYLSVFTVRQDQRAILLKLGKIVQTDISPGLHFKWPLIEQARSFDARLLMLDSQPERFLTSEKKNVMVDYFVIWRIRNFHQYYLATRGDEQRALLRLSQIMKDGLRSEFGKLTIQQAVAGKRSEIIDPIEVKVNKAVSELGIRVVDVRLKRIDLPPQVASSVYQRMEAERARVAAEFRAKGKEAAEKIRANADRERTVILANAYKESQILRGEGDAKAAGIYAQTYSKDPAFYAFYRSLKAYRKSFTGKGNILILEPNSQFFRYFNQAEGHSR